MGIIENRLKELDKIKKTVKIINYIEYDEPYIYDIETREYFAGVDMMENYYKDNNLEMPKFAYGVYFKPFILDLDYILENACEEHHEDTIDSLNGVIELKEALDKFNADNKSNGSYFKDINIIVKLF